MPLQLEERSSPYRSRCPRPYAETMAPDTWLLREARPLFSMLGDPRARHGLLGVSDPDVHLLDGRWTMFLGAVTTRFVVRIVQARLSPDSSPNDDGWRIIDDDRGRARTFGTPRRGDWDIAGQHSPTYVRGLVDGTQVDRIYYAGQRSRAFSGPGSRYAIGYLERSGDRWLRRDRPVLTGDWRRPSALEPFVIHADGRWRMWFLSAPGEVGRNEQPDYELRYTESDDGTTWDPPERFSGTDEGYFDNTVIPFPGGWRMLLARGTNLYGTEPYPGQGLWLGESTGDAGGRSSWSPLRRTLDTDADPGIEAWYAAGVCGPSMIRDGDRLHVFATGTHAPIPWLRAAWGRVRHGRSLPPPAPFFLTTGRFTFERGLPHP